MSFQFDHWEIYDIGSEKDHFHFGKKKKRVRYSDYSTVILIPSRQEYVDAGIDLWYKVQEPFAHRQRGFPTLYPLNQDLLPRMTSHCDEV